MKNKQIIFITALMLLVSLVSYTQKPAKVKPKTPAAFFTRGNALDWEYIIRDRTLAPSDIMEMEGGILKVNGVSGGYLRTLKKYSVFTLSLEYRWTKTAGNTGILVHIQPKDSIWPKCYQVQQKVDHVGDIICMNGLWAKECKDSVRFTVDKMKPANEKPLGEWNTVQVFCKKDSIIVYVNGLLQNKVSGLTAHSGYIGFQCEGTPFEFRNLTIK